MKVRRIVVNIMCALLVVFIVAGTALDFSTQLQRILEDETHQTLEEVSSHYKEVFADRISNHLKVMTVVSGSLSGMEWPSKADVQALLKSAVDSSGFSWIVASGADGRGISNVGEVSNVSDNDYFRVAMEGKSEVGEPIYFSENGMKVLPISAPIYDENGQAIGAVCGMYPLTVAGDKLLDNNYNNGDCGLIVGRDGKIIISSDTNQYGFGVNLMDFFRGVTITDASVKNITDTLDKNGSLTFAFTDRTGRHFASIQPSGINDWYIVNLTSDVLMRQKENVTSTIVFQMVVKLIVIGILIVIFVLVRERRHHKELFVANERYQSLIDNINGGVIVSRYDTVSSGILAVYATDAFTAMTGYTLDDIEEQFDGKYLDILYPDDVNPAFDEFLRQSATGNGYNISYRIVKKDGEIIWVIDSGYVVKDSHGERFNHSILTDITLSKKQEEALRLTDERFHIAIKASKVTVIEIDLQSKEFTHFENTEPLIGATAEELFAATKELSGCSQEEFLERSKKIFFCPEDGHIVDQALMSAMEGKNISFEARMKKTDGNFVWCRLDTGIILSPSGEAKRAVSYITDISAIKQNTEYLENQTQIDPLTGLYNKRATEALSNKILTDFPGAHHALIMLDIDNFKGVNDTLGHAFGDSVLVETSGALKALFRSDDIVGRIGGDEFAVLMKNVPDTNRVLRKATEIGMAFRRTHAGMDEEYKISCSMGIIMSDGAVEDFKALSHKADAALYQAKRNGKDVFVLYREEDAANYPITGAKAEDDLPDRQEAVRNIEEHLFELMYNSKDIQASINQALAMIGQRYQVSRAYIFENDSTNTYTKNVFEWCNNGIEPQIDNLSHVNISRGQESILDCYDENGIFYCSDVRSLPEHPRSILEGQGIRSTLRISIINDGVAGGFIGFDECRDYRIWTVSEVNTLSFLSKMLGVFMLKSRAEFSLRETLKSRLTVLDSLPDYICVVNPETHTIEYSNSKMQSVLPDAKKGAPCFTTLRGNQDSPCSTCLIERIKMGNMENLSMVSQDKKIKLSANALIVDWSGNQKMVLLYGKEVK